MPAVAIDVVVVAEELEFLRDATDMGIAAVEVELRWQGKNALLDCSQLAAGRVEYFKSVPPRKLAPDDIHSVACLIVDIVAIEPREKALLE